ncbi:MAG: HDIG domain-containing protein [Phycisphaerales bacterium]|nr:MAG: HDIG domain-containing protein [Phycisphaerales bacterium]
MNRRSAPSAGATTRDLFPSLDRIRSDTIRCQVEAVWNEAIDTGNAGRGWTTDELRELPFTLLADATPMRFIEHLNSCSEQCLAIADVLQRIFGERVPIDTDTLLAGALLADVGKLFEFERCPDRGLIQGESGRLLRHPFTGAALCRKHRLPDAITHIVATHSHEGDRIQRSIECIIFHHADFIDFDIAKALAMAARGPNS